MPPVKETLAEGIDIWLGDLRETMPLIGMVSHVIVDAPYEQRSHDATGSIRRSDGQPNPKALDFAGVDLLRPDLARLVKETCNGWFLVFCTTEGVAAWRDEIEAQGLKYKTPMIWIKPDAMPKMNGQGPSHGHECIASAWCGSGYAAWNGGGRRGVFTHCVNPPGRDGRHNTEKPISLMSELVNLFSSRMDIVCDPCMGSGSTGVACVKSGRRFIGIEIRKDYYKIARERIILALSEPDMFIETPPVMKQGKFVLNK